MMRVGRVLSAVGLVTCLVLQGGTTVFAENATKVAKKVRKKERDVAAPGRASGTSRTPHSDGSLDAGAKLDTIKEYRNDVDETVYAVSASRFDISPPLLEMAAQATPVLSGEEEEPRNPLLPSWRIPRSHVPDPVVSPVVPSSEALSSPATGFNFAGIGISGGSPSDSNGSVGNNQYVETVNTRYQVWSLNRATKVATSVLGPSNINTLWSGFGGPCEAQNSGRSDRALRQDRQSLADLPVHDERHRRLLLPVRRGVDDR